MPHTTDQVASLKKLRRKIDQLLLHPKNAAAGARPGSTPVVLAGDFNTLPYKSWDPAIAPPDAYAEMLRDGDVASAYPVAARDVCSDANRGDAASTRRVVR